MKTASVRLSEPAFCQLLAMMPAAGRLLLPEAAYSAKEFIRARQEWEEAGLAELDFDGVLHASPRFARMLWNLEKSRGVLRLRDTAGEIMFVRGPVDLLQIRRKAGEDGRRLAMRPLSEAAWAIKRRLREHAEWELMTQIPGEESPLLSKISPEEGQGGREEAIRAHLEKFYGKEAGQNAG